jgi:hypothetical protein
MGAPGWRKKFAGVGLGLQKFAAAKKSTYDKRAVQAKQQALNAKKVNKYKRLLKKLGNVEGITSRGSTPGSEVHEGSGPKGSQKFRIEKVLSLFLAPRAFRRQGNRSFVLNHPFRNCQRLFADGARRDPAHSCA